MIFELISGKKRRREPKTKLQNLTSLLAVLKEEGALGNYVSICRLKHTDDTYTLSLFLTLGLFLFLTFFLFFFLSRSFSFFSFSFFLSSLLAINRSSSLPITKCRQK